MSMLKRSNHRGYWYVGLAQGFSAWSEKGLRRCCRGPACSPSWRGYNLHRYDVPHGSTSPTASPKAAHDERVANVSPPSQPQELQCRPRLAMAMSRWPMRFETHITKGTAIEITNLYESIEQTKQQSMSWYILLRGCSNPKPKTVTWNYCHPTTSKIISSPHCKAHPEKPVLSNRSIHFGKRKTFEGSILWGLGVLLRTFLVWGRSGQTRKSEKSKSSCWFLGAEPENPKSRKAEK